MAKPEVPNVHRSERRVLATVASGHCLNCVSLRKNQHELDAIKPNHDNEERRPGIRGLSGAIPVRDNASGVAENLTHGRQRLVNPGELATADVILIAIGSDLMRQPELTIGMPVYNSASTIRAALESLLAQTYDNFVLVISDNNSSDGTGEICREYASRDPRIHYVLQTNNRGPANDFRFVLSKASTPFFMWATAEDLWTSTFVERTLNFLTSNSEYVCCQARVLVTSHEGTSHFGTGTYPLTGTWCDNAVQFFRNPADNLRYYGVFRTQALRSVFPTRDFYAYDWAVSAGTLKFGKHGEVPECLMIRLGSAVAPNGRSLRTDRGLLLWRIFPLLLMTSYCLRNGYVPWTMAGFDALARLNLYIACQVDLFDLGPFGRRYIQTQSLSYAILGRYSQIYQRFRSYWRTPRSLTRGLSSLPSLPRSVRALNIAPVQSERADQVTHNYEITGRDLSRHRTPGARVLYIDADTPTPDQRSGSIDAINIIKILQDFGFRTTFVPENNFAHRGTYTNHLQAMGVEAIYRPYYENIRDLILEKDRNFDLVIICRADIAHRHLDLILKLIPTARIVFNTVDLHFLREMRWAELSGQPELAEKARRVRESELASIRKADATIVLTNDEADIVRREVPNAIVHVIPLVRNPTDLRLAGPFASRSGVVFVGTYEHPPNADAVSYFVRDIWPLVRRRLPLVVFRIIGSGVTPDIQALAGNGVEIVGHVVDLDAVLGQSRVAVAPLRYGAGMKGKILSALLVGLPTVTTSIGTEGFGVTPGEEILVEDDPQQFADAVVRLYTDEDTWTRLSKNGLKFSRTNFSLDIARDKVQNLLSDIGFDMSLSPPQMKLEDTELTCSARQLQKDILDADPIYQPSKVLSNVAEQYFKHLSHARIRNFKRAINANFYQWLPRNGEDNQFGRLLAFFHDRPSELPLSILAVSGRPGAVLDYASASANSPCEQDHYFEFYTFFVGLLWHYVSCQDSLGIHRTLEEPRLGDPLPIRLGNRIISEDLANSLHEWLRVNRASIDVGLAKHRRVLEIGAGYGRLAYVFLIAGPCQYVIVDTAPTLFLASWYLQNVFPHRRIFKYRSFEIFEEVRAEFEAADICFLGPHQLGLLPDHYFDIAISIGSFQEMTLDQVNHYRALIERQTKYIVYLKQRIALANGSGNPTLERTDYVLREPWRLVLDIRHPIQSKLTELLFVRKEI
jgi:putative sugar O-methyltransferase